MNDDDQQFPSRTGSPVTSIPKITIQMKVIRKRDSYKYTLNKNLAKIYAFCNPMYRSLSSDEYRILMRLKKIKDETVKRYVHKAIKLYQLGFYPSCVVELWRIIDYERFSNKDKMNLSDWETKNKNSIKLLKSFRNPSAHHPKPIIKEEVGKFFARVGLECVLDIYRPPW